MSRLVGRGGVRILRNGKSTTVIKRGSGNADFCKGGKGVWNKNFVTHSQMAHLDGVAVDDGPVLLEVLGGEAALMNDLHLLHDRALPRLPRA